MTPVLTRRATVSLALLAAARPAAAANGRSDIPDVAISCDATLRPAVRRVGALFTARTRAPVHLFSAAPPLMLAQIERETQTDLLITLTQALDEGARRGLLMPGMRVDGWRNGLVIAARQGSGTDLAKLLGAGRFAVTDPTIAATFDGAAVLARMGLSPPMLGAANTGEVAFLLTSGAARLGLLQRTDVVADPALIGVAAVPDAAYAPIIYGAAAAVTSYSPNTRAFLDFLRTPRAREQLRAAGLDSAA